MRREKEGKSEKSCNLLYLRALFLFHVREEIRGLTFPPHYIENNEKLVVRTVQSECISNFRLISLVKDGQSHINAPIFA